MAACRLRIAVLVSALTGGIMTAQSRPADQTQEPTFRVQTTLIEVDAVVSDAQGNIVRGLTKDDFVIFDDGAPQPISAFAFVDLPIEQSARPAPSHLSDVDTNERPFDGRVYVLILDDLHVDPDYAADVIKEARLFIERYFGDNDLMGVVYTSGRKDVSEDFTSNRQVLLATVGQFVGRRPLTLSTPSLTGTPPNTNSTRGSIDLERASNAQRTVRLIRNLADWTNETMPTRHKAFVLFSQGIEGFSDTFSAIGETTSSGSKIADEMREAIAATARANASIFTVDARGVSALVNGAADDFRERLSTGGHGSLRALADETGGRTIVRTNNFDDAFERVVRDNSSYYVLAYAEPPDTRPSAFHSITVRVKRPGVEVRARRSYKSPGTLSSPQAVVPVTRATKVSAQVNAAINSPIPQSGVTLSVFATPFKGKGKNASVLIGAELGNLAVNPADANGRLRDEVELSLLVFGTREAKDGRTDHVHVALQPDTEQRTHGGVRVLHRLDLPPGKYQLRVAARDGNSGKVGSVTHNLEVPDFNDRRTPLAMSGLVLTSTRSDLLTTSGDKERLTSILPGAPAALRRFPQDEEITVLAEIYDGDTTGHQDTIITSILNESGQSVLERTVTASNEVLHPASGGYEHRVRIRLNNLVPGRYVLRVAARSNAQRAAMTSREIPFTVSP